MIWCAWLFYGACAVYVVVYLHVCLGCLGDGWCVWWLCLTWRCLFIWLLGGRVVFLCLGDIMACCVIVLCWFCGGLDLVPKFAVVLACVCWLPVDCTCFG